MYVRRNKARFGCLLSSSSSPPAFLFNTCSSSCLDFAPRLKRSKNGIKFSWTKKKFQNVTWKVHQSSDRLGVVLKLNFIFMMETTVEQVTTSTRLNLILNRIEPTPNRAIFVLEKCFFNFFVIFFALNRLLRVFESLNQFNRVTNLEVGKFKKTP